MIWPALSCKKLIFTTSPADYQGFQLVQEEDRHKEILLGKDCFLLYTKCGSVIVINCVILPCTLHVSVARQSGFSFRLLSADVICVCWTIYLLIKRINGSYCEPGCPQFGLPHRVADCCHGDGLIYNLLALVFNCSSREM